MACASTTIILRQEGSDPLYTRTDGAGRFKLLYNIGHRLEESDGAADSFTLLAVPHGAHDTVFIQRFYPFPNGARVRDDTEPVRATFFLQH